MSTHFNNLLLTSSQVEEKQYTLVDLINKQFDIIYESVIKDILLDLLKREPTLDDAGKLIIKYDFRKSHLRYIYYNEMFLGLIKIDFNLSSFSVKFTPWDKIEENEKDFNDF